MMRTKARWLQSATMMAFLAVVALFVSPVLALNCVCADSVVTVHQPNHACCADETTSHHQAISQAGAVASDDCLCRADAATAAFVAPDVARFFAPVAAVLPARFNFQPQADVRRATYAHFAAQPRAPDRTLFLGRAPPALALS